MTYRRKKYHKGDTHLKKRWRVRNRKRDLDQIDEDLKPEKAETLLHQDVDIDKPGDAQFYCLHCANTECRPILNPRPNLKSKFGDLPKLEANIAARGIKADASGLKSLFEFCNNLQKTRDAVESRRLEITNQLKNLSQIGGEEAKNEIERLKIEGRMVRDDRKELLKAFWEVEEKMMIGSLALPNDLHPDTPLDKERIHEILSPTPDSNTDKRNHMELGKDLIDLRKPYWYYLKKDAAIFDLATMFYFSDILKENGFSRLIPPDFVHSAIMEGCGSSPEAALRLNPSTENLNLVGGASLFPFCALYTKRKTPHRSLPIRQHAAGRRYESRNGPGLFGVWQRTCVDVFVLAESESKITSEFYRTLDILTNLFKKLNWPVKIVFLPAKMLHFWEALHVSFQMKSISQDKWVEIGFLSISNAFISERILIEISKGTDIQFGHILSGTAIDVTTVLACLMEQNGKVVFPKDIESYKPH